MAQTTKLGPTGITVQLEQANLEVATGTTVLQQIKLVSQAPALTNFNLALVGLPAEWYSFSRPSLALFPNWSEKVELEINLPPQVSPANYRLRVTASSASGKGVQGEAFFQLQVVEATNSAPAVIETKQLPSERPTMQVNARDLPPVGLSFEPSDGFITMSANGVDGTAGPPGLEMAVSGSLSASTPHQEAPVQKDERPAPQPGGEPNIESGLAELAMDQSSFRVKPGQSVKSTIKLTNLGQASDQFAIAVQGLPDDWWQVNPANCSLFPHWWETILLLINVPTGTAPLVHIGKLVVRSTAQGQPAAQTSFKLEVVGPPVLPSSASSLTVSAPPTIRLKFPPGAPARGTRRLIDQNSPTLRLDQMPPAISVPTTPTAPLYPLYPTNDYLSGAGETLPLASGPVSVEPKPARRSFWQGLFGGKTRPPAIPLSPPSLAHFQPVPGQAIAPALPPIYREVAEVPLELAPGQPLQEVYPENPLAVELQAPVAPAVVKLSSTETVSLPYTERGELVEMKVDQPSALTELRPDQSPASPGDSAILELAGPAWLYDPAPLPPEPLGTTPEAGETAPPETAGRLIQATEDDRTEAGENKGLRIKLEKTDLKIWAGRYLEQQLSLTNLSKLGDTFKVRMQGVPLDWVQLSSASVYLFPGWSESLYFRIDVPSEAPPGQYEGQISLTAQSQPETSYDQVTFNLQTLAGDPAGGAEDKNYPPDARPDLEQGGPVKLEVNERRLSVVAGRQGDFEVRLSNQSGLFGTFIVDLAGLPQEWYSFSCSAMTLFPGWREEFYLWVHVPGNIETKSLPFKIVAQPQEPYQQTAEIELELTVQAQPSLGGLGSQVKDFSSEGEAKTGTKAGPAASPTGFSNSLGGQLTHGLSTPANVPGPGETEEGEGAAGGSPFYEKTSLAQLFAPLVSPAPELVLIPGVIVPEATPAPLPQPRRNWWQRLFGRKSKSGPQFYPISEVAQAGRLAAMGPPQYAASQKVVDSASSTMGDGAGETTDSTAATLPAQNRAANGQGEALNQNLLFKLSQKRVTIVSGESGTLEFELVNQTTLTDDFDLAVEGLPPTWYKLAVETINLFPGWHEELKLGFSLSLKVRPGLYRGRLMAVSRAQSGIRAEVPLEVEVTAPLKMEARLRPHRATGFRAKYSLVIRNGCLSKGQIKLALSQDNEYCQARFTPDEIVVEKGESEVVAVEIRLRPKTPGDQARQIQPFELQLSPEWLVGEQLVKTNPILVEGEYHPEARWGFLLRHPVLFGLSLVLVALTLIIFWLLPLLVQGSIWAYTANYPYEGNIGQSKTMAVVDQALNQKLEGLNPVMAILNPQIQFNEPSQKFVIRLNPPFALPSTSARGSVNVTDGNLQIMPDEADKNSLVWYFLSPQALSKHLTNALRGWVARDAPGNKINRVEIEGTTLFIRLAGCSQDDPACNPHRQS